MKLNRNRKKNPNFNVVSLTHKLEKPVTKRMEDGNEIPKWMEVIKVPQNPELTSDEVTNLMSGDTNYIEVVTDVITTTEGDDQERYVVVSYLHRELLKYPELSRLLWLRDVVKGQTFGEDPFNLPFVSTCVFYSERPGVREILRTRTDGKYTQFDLQNLKSDIDHQVKVLRKLIDWGKFLFPTVKVKPSMVRGRENLVLPSLSLNFEEYENLRKFSEEKGCSMKESQLLCRFRDIYYRKVG